MKKTRIQLPWFFNKKSCNHKFSPLDLVTKTSKKTYCKNCNKSLGDLAVQNFGVL